ncbi:transglycosylase domain-containing protein [Mangrovicella endophytica]|uniref:transglycosylase domain-containing protein n=1 Tax=Mangrovicella endophytica TaxID=2066697 RepID=UPI000C9DB22F|nr:transglycosylase domain-containing protein [Mangrovicella endophytica]
MTRRRGSWLRLAGVAFAGWVVLPLVVGIAFLVAWAPTVIDRYEVSRQTTVDRVRSNRLVVDLARDRDKPWNASVEEAMYVELRNIPPVMVDAVLNSEDRRYYHIYRHIGFDPIGFVKAAASGFRRGGSSIAQQLAKNVYVGNAPTVKRKLEELAVALWLERNFSKDEILELYLNTVFMGEETKGIEAAARHYFGYSFKFEGAQKPFTPMMAARLAVTIKDPSFGNPDKPRNAERAKRLLAAMETRGVGSLTPATAKAFKLEASRRDLREHHLDSRFQFARDIAVREAGSLVPQAKGAVDIVSHYDSETQLYVERAIDRYARGFARAGYDQLVAYVVNNRTGGIEAIVAPPAPTFYPGSTVKPFVALCGLVDHGMTADSTVEDSAVGVPPVANFDHHYLGKIRLAESLAKSRNPPFVRLLARWGASCPNASLAKMGSPFRFKNASIRQMALGAEPVPLMDILQSYVTLASCGRIAEAPRLVKEIRDRKDGRILYRHRPGGVAMNDKLLAGYDALHSMLSETARAGGTADGSRFRGAAVAAKTGTSDDNRQVTLVTFTADYTVLVSVAASNPKRIQRPLTGHALVGLVRRINANIHDGLPVTPLGCDAKTVVASR